MRLVYMDGYDLVLEEELEAVIFFDFTGFTGALPTFSSSMRAIVRLWRVTSALSFAIS